MTNEKAIKKDSLKQKRKNILSSIHFSLPFLFFNIWMVFLFLPKLNVLGLLYLIFAIIVGSVISVSIIKFRRINKSIKEIEKLRKNSVINYQKGEFEKATELIKKAIHLDPADYTLFYDLAKIYLDTERYEEAFDACNRSLDIEPKFEEANALLEKINSLGIE